MIVGRKYKSDKVSNSILEHRRPILLMFHRSKLLSCNRMHWVWYIILSIIALVLIGFGIVVALMKQPSLNNCGRAGPEYIRPQCVSINELYADSTVPTPSQPIYLLKFTYDPSAASLGGPPCNPLWYAYRYVRTSDGGYGPLSSWTTQPIYAGSPNPPCVPVTGQPPNNWCSLNGIATGCGSGGSSTFNEPVVGTTGTLELSLADGYVLNLHRQVGTFDPTSEGQLVGQLIAPSRSSSTGPTSFWYDISFSTNSGNTRCCAS